MPASSRPYAPSLARPLAEPDGRELLKVWAYRTCAAGTPPPLCRTSGRLGRGPCQAGRPQRRALAGGDLGRRSGTLRPDPRQRVGPPAWSVQGWPPIVTTVPGAGTGKPAGNGAA